MTSFRSHLSRLADIDELTTVTDPVHWDGDAATIAHQGTRIGGPALRFDDTPGRVRFASGVLASPDVLGAADDLVWRRLSTGLGISDTTDYVELLSHLETADPEPIDTNSVPGHEPDATAPDLHALGLPSMARGQPSAVTLGLIAAERDGETTWAPVRGSVHNATGLRLSVPASFVSWCDTPTDVRVLLGVPAGALVASLQRWTGQNTDCSVPERALSLSGLPIERADRTLIPGSPEVTITGQLHRSNASPGGAEATWELGCETVGVDVDVDRITHREDPIVPFTPLGAPLADDVHLMSIIVAARLQRRLNGYWGVSPVRWIRLPVEARLGLCVVASDILYAGFEWQLANTLFYFSQLFDKVLVLDETSEPANLTRALDDMWVKAHPAHDWKFSESDAPAASAPSYRTDGEAGTRLYIDGTWDPGWDEEYIAPRVTFETSYPENVRTTARERLEALGYGGSDE